MQQENILFCYVFDEISDIIIKGKGRSVMVNIGEKLKNLRKERELTLDMLVADLNQTYPDIKVNKSMLSRWERGENDPSLEYAKHLSMYFNVSLDYLIGLTDVRTPSRLLVRNRL